MSSRAGVRTLETAVLELFDSRAESRVYLFLLRHDGVLSDEVVRGTRLHPSTVRELLSAMYDARVISRRKLRTESIGKNPYLYYAVSPLVLLRRRVKTLERRLNLVASVASPQNGDEPMVRIWIRGEDA
jgi:transcription initiation factor IIE alpha subunit